MRLRSAPSNSKIEAVCERAYESHDVRHGRAARPFGEVAQRIASVARSGDTGQRRRTAPRLHSSPLGCWGERCPIETSFAKLKRCYEMLHGGKLGELHAEGLRPRARWGCPRVAVVS